MPRIRTIKPEFWVDEKIVELDPWARLLFIGLWNFADDQGFIEYSPRRIKMQIFPGDTTDVVPLLARLLEDGLLAAYQSPTGAVLHVVSWTRHQKVSNPATPRFELSELEPFILSTDPHTEASRGVQSPRSGKERKGKEGKGDAATSAAREEPAAQPTITQRSKRITDAYAEIEKMCNWPAINGMVIKAIKAEKWTDDEIRDALLRLAKEHRTVTVNSIRVELDGFPPFGSTQATQAGSEPGYFQPLPRSS
jgi:hypothetical protein